MITRLLGLMAIDLVNTSLFEFSIIFSCHDVHKRIFFQSLIALPYSQFQSFSILSLLEFLFMIYLCNIYHLLEIPWTLSEGVFIFCFIFLTSAQLNYVFLGMLNSGDGPRSLSWEERLQIAHDVSHGIEYLHEGVCRSWTLILLASNFLYHLFILVNWLVSLFLK